MSKTLGYIFLGIAFVTLMIGAIFFGGGVTSGGLTASGAILGGAILFFVLVAPLTVIGIVTLTRAKNEQQGDEKAAELRKVLDMVSTRGTVNISDIVIETGSTTGEVQNMVYRLVGMGLFNGYVNWDEGKLYSMEASKLNELSFCKNCGGQIKLVGKGVSKCPYCGTEYFIA